MSPVAHSSAESAFGRADHTARSREVFVDLPPTIAVLPGEAELIAGMIGDALIELFRNREENWKASRRHEGQLQDERT